MKNKSIEIIIVEDEEDIIELIEYHLQKAGYTTTSFLSTEKVEQFLSEEHPALLIMDRNLPGMEGSEFVSALRKKGFDIPVIFLTAKDRESELEEGFTRGGDDYMSKPFRPRELVLRIEALLRRSGSIQHNTLTYRDLRLDFSQHLLTINQDPIELSNLEFKLLYTFMQRPNIAIERDFLRDEVWGDNSANFNDKTINVTINRLKNKIDPTGEKKYISPIWGIGYKLI